MMYPVNEIAFIVEVPIQKVINVFRLSTNDGYLFISIFFSYVATLRQVRIQVGGDGGVRPLQTPHNVFCIIIIRKQRFHHF